MSKQEGEQHQDEALTRRNSVARSARSGHDDDIASLSAVLIHRTQQQLACSRTDLVDNEMVVTLAQCLSLSSALGPMKGFMPT